MGVTNWWQETKSFLAGLKRGLAEDHSVRGLTGHVSEGLWQG